MSKDKLRLLSPLFLKYQSEFEKNSRSRVFAPLAESYRKLGMTDKAMDILSQGIRFHPSYLMGYLGLAFCYYDLKQFNLAYSTLRPLIENNRDNIRLQKLFSDICLELGKKEEALETLKYLLFINPRDKEIGELVLRVEREVEERYKPLHKPIIILEEDFDSSDHLASESVLFNLNKLNAPTNSENNDFDNWLTVDLNHKAKTEIKEPPDKKLTESFNSHATNYDHWNVEKGDETRSYHVHLDLEDDADPLLESLARETYNSPVKPDENSETKANTPWVTHTLVDLYCGQGHIGKALEVLEKILLLNPNDLKTIKKIEEIQGLIQPRKNYSEEVQPKIEQPLHIVELTDLEEVSEEDGRRNLMNLIDEKLGPIEIIVDHSKQEKAMLIESKLSQFLLKIKKRALDYQERI